MALGEVLSVELRKGHRLDKVTLASEHQLQLLVGEFGLVYWITIGKAGVLEIIGRLVKDDDGFFTKLKADLSDTAMRGYLVKRTLADSNLPQEQEQFPEIMAHAQAAKYLGPSPKTLYNLREVPRLKHNRYRKEDLDRYLQPKVRKWS